MAFKITEDELGVGSETGIIEAVRGAGINQSSYGFVDLGFRLIYRAEEAEKEAALMKTSSKFAKIDKDASLATGCVNGQNLWFVEPEDLACLSSEVGKGFGPSSVD